MVAQKVVDAKHTHKERGSLVTTSDARTTTFWTLLERHSMLSLFISSDLIQVVLTLTMLRTNLTLQSCYFTFDALGACNSNLFLYRILVEVVKRVTITVNGAAMM